MRPPPTTMPHDAPARSTARWTRRFALLSLACVLITAAVSATILSRSTAERMVRRNAELAQDFVQSLVRLHGEQAAFIHDDGTTPPEIEALFSELARMPGLIHANLYSRDRRVVWSTNSTAIGRTPGANPELDEALAGTLALESALLETASFIKPEHAFVPNAARDTIETYIPVRDPTGAVTGVAELYLSPQPLIDSVHQMTRDVWIASAGSGLFVFLALVGLAVQADRLLAQQQRRLLAQESLAAVGDMASAVAHGIRNPLGSIRSSAELIALGPDAAQAQDIMAEVDRLQAWTVRLLAYAQQTDRTPTAVALPPLVRNVLDAQAARATRQGVDVQTVWSEPVPPARGDGPALEQALGNLVSNALDAMPEGGTLTLRVVADRETVRVDVVDTGTGMSADELARVFAPFHTTKRTGLGVGLPLVRRTVERLGGRIELRSEPGHGTSAHLVLPRAEPTPSTAA